MDVWTCVGALEFLLRDYEEASTLLHDVKTTEIVNSKDFLTNIHELGKKMKVNVNRLVSLSEKNLEKYDNSACYDDDTTLPDIPEWDPGLRPGGANRWAKTVPYYKRATPIEITKISERR